MTRQTERVSTEGRFHRRQGPRARDYLQLRLQYEKPIEKSCSKVLGKCLFSLLESLYSTYSLPKTKEISETFESP